MRRATVIDADFFRSRTQANDRGCWIWQGSAQVQGNDRRARWNGGYAYRESYSFFVGEIPPGAQINHHCDDGMCVNPDHLYAGTQRQNVDDMHRRDRGFVPEAPRGESHYLAYPEQVVDEVRRRYSAGETQKAIAADLGLSLGSVRGWISGGNRGRAPIKRQPAECGTRAGYFAHRRQDEKPCTACLEANREYMRAYKAGRAA